MKVEQMQSGSGAELKRKWSESGVNAKRKWCGSELEMEWKWSECKAEVKWKWSGSVCIHSSNVLHNFVVQPFYKTRWFWNFWSSILGYFWYSSLVAEMVNLQWDTTRFIKSIICSNSLQSVYCWHAEMIAGDYLKIVYTFSFWRETSSIQI